MKGLSFNVFKRDLFLRVLVVLLWGNFIYGRPVYSNPIDVPALRIDAMGWEKPEEWEPQKDLFRLGNEKRIP